jgi:ureidoglycolate lyase
LLRYHHPVTPEFPSSRINTVTEHTVYATYNSNISPFSILICQVQYQSSILITTREWFVVLPMATGMVTMDGLPTTLVVEALSLTPISFSDFGTVVENPDPALKPSTEINQLPSNAVQANQGTAIKYQHVTHMLDLYSSAPSKKSSRAVMNMFVCAPRELQPTSEETVEGIFRVEILERHPFTAQTFIPLGLSPAEQDEARYLVVVAPSLPLSPKDQVLPVPPELLPAGRLPGRGLPDLTKTKAFIAKGSQAITYGAGTWHAPMVVIGRRAIDFVVVQFANGVAIEDCQEVFFRSQGRAGIQVAVPKVRTWRIHGSHKL